MVIGSLAPPLSAFSAYGVGTQVTAHNLANVLTNNFKAGQVTYSDLPGQSGVRIASIGSASAAGPLVPYGHGLPESPGRNLSLPDGFAEGSTTDVAREMVKLIVDSRTYQANTRTVSTSDETLGTIINMKV
jgi:Flagellar basal body rod protein